MKPFVETSNRFYSIITKSKNQKPNGNNRPNYLKKMHHIAAFLLCMAHPVFSVRRTGLEKRKKSTKILINMNHQNLVSFCSSIASLNWT